MPLTKDILTCVDSSTDTRTKIQEHFKVTIFFGGGGHHFMKWGGLWSSSQRLILSIGKTKIIGFFITTKKGYYWQKVKKGWL